MAFEDSSARALDVMNGLVSAAESGRSHMLDMRDRILAATERFEADWAFLRERARVFLEQSTSQEQQLVALKSEAGRAADSLREHLQELQEQGEQDTQTTQVEVDALGVDTEEEGDKVRAVLELAEAAEQALSAGLRDVEADLAHVLGDAAELLHGALATDVRHVENEVERGAIELSAYVSGQWVPAIEQKAYDLYTFLAQAEAEVRATLESALEANETGADVVLRDCADRYDDTFHDLARLGGALEDLLDDLREFIEDGRQTLEERKGRWDESVRRGREGLRDALESLHQVEQYLARFSFTGGR